MCMSLSLAWLALSFHMLISISTLPGHHSKFKTFGALPR
jgi:hypothetical protein